MPDKYELIYGYFHCTGKTEYIYGYTDDEEKAKQWVDDNMNNQLKTIRVPDEDPIRCCPAVFCPVKAGKPFTAYRKVL
jgi:hypothetical protein